ncbi:MAG: hypothetical protein LQ351_004325 [Letrouitia transgressa]|nr:MAG: hypothetical protein LQ351_004325 [Letrouitia transgressa]
MKTITLSPDKKFASVQPGAKWIEVYTYLDALGYAIPGGRAGDVGVGGLTTGGKLSAINNPVYTPKRSLRLPGGNSFFAARYGFVCDNVQNFEVVLGSGKIVNANAKTNPDLFQALKGGSNNLGLVTRFDIVAFPQGPLWGGTALYNITKREQLQPHLKALNAFTNSIAQDPYGSLILVWSYLPQTKQYSFNNLYEYTRPVTDPKIFPPPFKDFAPTSPVGPPATNTLRIAGLANLTGELDAPRDLRNIYATITFTNDLKVLSKVTDLVQGIFTKTLRNPFYTYYSIQYQPLPASFASHSVERGGNVLGLERYKDNNIIFLLNVAWQDAKYDAEARRLADETINTLTKYTRSVGALKDFVYLNYADINQDPIRGYGSASVAKLKAASKKYDPGQVFQKLVPGGFKLR